MKENYVEFVKLERKLNDVEIKIESETKSDAMKLFAKGGLNYLAKFVLGLSIFLVVIFNRNQPVIVFSDKFNFAPFSRFISYPSNIENCISLPFWVFINNYVSRQLAATLIK